MYKLVDSSSFFKDNEPCITLLSLEGSTGLEKKAADSRISSFVEALKPKTGKSYLHINAMGAGEYYGANRNGDYFPEAQLIEYHKTFETSPAHFFRHHINKDPAKANGVVIFSVYNERMHRVELIVEVDLALAQDIENRILAGDFPSTSMACKTPYDVCSICGNKAASTAAYCTHLKNELGRMYPDGRKVMALNLGPLRFFDISYVIRPADVTSSVLTKVANEIIPSSAELAENEGLGSLEAFREKKASLKKMSELIKEVTGGVVVDTSPELTRILRNVQDLPHSLVDSLKDIELTEVLNELAVRGINPSTSFLAELIGRKALGEKARGIGPVVEGYMKSVGPDIDVPVIPMTLTDARNPVVGKMLDTFLDGSSLLPQFVEKRASEVGYFGLGPRIEPTYNEERHAYLAKSAPQVVHVDNQPPKEDNVLWKVTKLLIGLGGAAILAKAYINSQIERRIASERSRAENGVKITIVKTASDYSTAAYLSKVAMANDFPVQPIQPLVLDTPEESGSGFSSRLLYKMTKGLLGKKVSPQVAQDVSTVLGVGSVINKYKEQ